MLLRLFLQNWDAPNKNPTKRLAAIFKLAFNVIPEDPTLKDYHQSATLGSDIVSGCIGITY